MKILLLGDYSNVHATLAEGLRSLGHEVTLASDGDSWKGYPRDLDLARPTEKKGVSHKGRRTWHGALWQKITYQFRLLCYFWSFKGYDVVQLINPIFLPLKAERIWPYYRWLRKWNRSVFLGAFGMDHYYVKACEDCNTFRYSDFNMGKQLRDREDCKVWSQEWGRGAKGHLNQTVAEDVDGIVAGLYEYWASYAKEFSHKLTYIPFPIISSLPSEHLKEEPKTSSIRPLRFFIGIQQTRHSYKGTDLLLTALERLKTEYPQEVEIIKAENVPFAQYKQMLRSADVLLDQIYSYTPAMNALQAMACGVVVVSGAEPEHYELLGCHDLRPIVNVLPDETDIYQKLKQLLLQREQLSGLSQQSLTYIRRYHDHKKVAQEYIDFWTRHQKA